MMMENKKKSSNQTLLITLIFFMLLSNNIYSQKHSFKVITIAMFETGEMTGDEAGEAQLWYERDSLFLEMKIPGAYSPLYYNKKGQGLIVTGMGVSNAASTIMALGLNPNIDLRNTYFIIAGVAGTSPKVCTIGSAIWAEWIVSKDLCHAIDAREIPEDWVYARFRLGCNEHWCDNNDWNSGSEVFRLDSALTHIAYQLTKNVELFDTDEVQNIRNKFSENSQARRKPFVTIGDNISGNTFFYGKIISDWADWWVKKWTNGKGTYYTTNMEDSGTLTALKRLADANIISYNRILILRTASDFDQQYPGKTVEESINDVWLGFPLAIENAYRVGSVVAREIINNWEIWENNFSLSMNKNNL
jgi:purine nucleoside permease